MNRADMVEQALSSLEWLIDLQVDSTGTVSLIGNNGWLTREGQRARFDQQPIEAMALVEACVDAWRITIEQKWLDRAKSVLGWFTGRNELGVCLVDPETGGCADGLHMSGPSLNQGAESTLAWLIAALTLAEVERETASEEEVLDLSSARVMRSVEPSSQD